MWLLLNGRGYILYTIDIFVEPGWVGLADTTYAGHFEHVRRWISLDPRYYTQSCDPVVAISALSFQITAGKDTEHTMSHTRMSQHL